MADLFLTDVLETLHAGAWSHWHMTRRRNAIWQTGDKEMFFCWGRRQTLKTDMRCLWTLTMGRVCAAKWRSKDLRLPGTQLTEPFTKFSNFFRLDESCGMFKGGEEAPLCKQVHCGHKNYFCLQNMNLNSYTPLLGKDVLVRIFVSTVVLPQICTLLLLNAQQPGPEHLDIVDCFSQENYSTAKLVDEGLYQAVAT